VAGLILCSRRRPMPGWEERGHRIHCRHRLRGELCRNRPPAVNNMSICLVLELSLVTGAVNNGRLPARKPWVHHLTLVRSLRDSSLLISLLHSAHVLLVAALPIQQ
jgi:hypothetical protein